LGSFHKKRPKGSHRRPWRLGGTFGTLFRCDIRRKIRVTVEKLKNHANEIFLGVSIKNQRFYINPVRNEKGELIGYFERFKVNLQK
jgi:hypothetical protein